MGERKRKKEGGGEKRGRKIKRRRKIKGEKEKGKREKSPGVFSEGRGKYGGERRKKKKKKPCEMLQLEISSDLIPSTVFYHFVLYVTLYAVGILVIRLQPLLHIQQSLDSNPRNRSITWT